MRGQWKNRRDANEAEIVETLRAHGFSVVSLDTPLDLLVGYGARTHLVEVKMPKGKLTKAQEAFLSEWRGDATILRSVEEAEEWCRRVRG